MGYNPKFDLDLQFGQQGENWLRWLGTDQAKVEVKTERDTWASTGNAVFEYAYRGQPSGVAKTEADWWVHVLSLAGEVRACYVFNVIYLKENLRMVYRNPAQYGCVLTKGGDGNMSDVILVPIRNLHYLACGPETGVAKSR